MFVRTLFLILAAALLAPAQSKLTLRVFTGHGQQGYDVNSTMISGEKEMIVIDPQFSLSWAHRLAAEILESGKTLTTIYMTHPHPDHFFGVAVLKQAFPSARFVALPAPAAAVKTAWPGRQKFWQATYGSNIPGPEPILPEELAESVLTIEGNRLPITGGVQGMDGPGNSYVYVPSLSAVITGDVLFDHVYFGVQKDKGREDWRKTIAQIQALNPKILVPGHQGPGATDDTKIIDWMNQYVADWDKTVAASKNADEMKAAWLKSHPGLGMEFTLDQRIATYFPAATAK